MSQRPGFTPLSVGFVLTAALVLVTTIILFGFGYYNYHTRSVSASKEMSDNAQRMANRLSKSLSLAVWNMDSKQVQEALLSEMGEKQVLSLVVREPDYMGVFAATGRDSSWNPVDIDGSQADEHAYFAKAAIEHQGMQTGVIEVSITNRFVQDELRQMLWTSVGSTLIVDFAIVVILILVITMLVIKPLDVMQGYAQAVGAGNLEHQEMTGYFFGELGALKGHLEAMVRKLSANLEQMQEAEAALKKSEEKYRAIFSNAPIGIFRTSFDGDLIDANPTMAKMLGYADRQHLLSSVTDLGRDIYLRSEDRQTFLDALRASPKGVSVEMEFKRLDGTPFYAIINAALPPDTDGPRTFIDGTIQDITERKQAEKALLESEERYRSVIQNMQDVYYRTDAEGRLIMISPSGLRMYGAESMDEVLGQPISSIYMRSSERSALLAKLQSGDIVYDHEILLRRKDGTPVQAAITASFYRDAAGNVLGVEGIFRDITERKQAEERLRQSEEKFSRIFEMAPECITFVRLKDSVIIDANAAFETITGHPRKEAIGRPAPDLDVWDDPASRKDFMRRLRTDGRVKDFEFVLKRKDGELRRVVNSAQLVLVAGEQCYVNIIHDITNERRMQELLIQSEKMMSVGSLAAGIAHEINNPLGIVHQAVQNLILRTCPDQKKNLEAAACLDLPMEKLQAYLKARKLDVFLEDIQSAALRASGIIRNMLNFSRRSESKRQTCDLNRIIEQSVFLASSDYDLKKSYDFKRIEISLDLAEDLPECSCTETEIEQVLLNLLRNAAQAMAMANPPTPNPRIDIRMRPGEDCVHIEVADNGPGIDPDTQRKVFEPFFTTKPPGVGTGLGLSVSYFIITKGHGGKMWMASSPGKGTTFFIELPADSGEAAHG